jgi:hypothetical protein
MFLFIKTLILNDISCFLLMLVLLLFLKPNLQYFTNLLGNILMPRFETY